MIQRTTGLTRGVTLGGRAATAGLLLGLIAASAHGAPEKGAISPDVRSYGPPKEFENVGHTTQPVRPTYRPLKADPVKVRANEHWARWSKGPHDTEDTADAEVDPAHRIPTGVADLVLGLHGGPSSPVIGDLGALDAEPWTPATVQDAGRFADIAPAGLSVPAVPTPGASLVLGLGALGLARRRR